MRFNNKNTIPIVESKIKIKSIEKTPMNNNIRYHLIRVACAGWTKEMFDL